MFHAKSSSLNGNIPIYPHQFLGAPRGAQDARQLLRPAKLAALLSALQSSDRWADVFEEPGDSCWFMMVYRYL